MTALGSQTIAASYEQLLHVDTDGGGDTTTLVPIKDGDNGTTFCLQLATTSALIVDDAKLYFGTGSDASFEYDEDGNDVLLYDGANFRINDDTQLQFGAAADWTVEYDEDGNDDLVFTGSDMAIESSTSAKPLVIIKNTTNDTTAPTLRFVMDKGAAGADGDDCGTIEFYGDDDNQDNIAFATILAEVADATSTDEAGALTFKVIQDGNYRNYLTLKGYNGSVDQGEIIFNEDSQDADFRVESDNDANAFFIQGSSGNVGIGTAAPQDLLHIQGLSVNSGSVPIALMRLSINDEVNQDMLAGQGPAIEFRVGQNTVVTSDYVSGVIAAVKEDSNDGNVATAMTFWTGADGADATEKVRIDSSGNVGIGTAAIPHGGIGEANFAIDATNPRIQITDSGDDYPVWQFYSGSHDDTSLGFDIYNDGGTWKSSDVGSNFLLYKVGDAIKFMYDSGIAQGSTVSLNNGLVLDTAGDVTVSTGNLVIGTNGKGIDFSANTSDAAGMSAEILDDYETGTWDAVVTAGGNPMTMHGSYDTGYYTKVGNLVTVSGFFVTTSLGSASGNVSITGLPFTVANNVAAYSGGGAVYGNNLDLAAAGQSVSYFGAYNTTYIELYVWDATTGSSNMQASEWTAAGQLVISFSYRAA